MNRALDGSYAKRQKVEGDTPVYQRGHDKIARYHCLGSAHAEAGTEDPGHVDSRRHHLREGRRHYCEVVRDSANVEGFHTQTVMYAR